MKTTLTRCAALAVLLWSCTSVYAQQLKYNLGGADRFVSGLQKQEAVQKQNGLSVSTRVNLDINPSTHFEAIVNYSSSKNGEYAIRGQIADVKGSTVFIDYNQGKLSGSIIVEGVAYSYTSDKAGNAYVTPVDIDDVICVEYDKDKQPHSAHVPASTTRQDAVAAAGDAYKLQSLPGSPYVIYLDFDGYNLPAGSRWNSGNPINAAPSGFSEAQMTETWELSAEDFRPWNVNVTTDESVFNASTPGKRIRAVMTPTNTAAPGSGGVAYIGSFNFTREDPVWVYNLGTKSAGETISHEVGHSLYLGHDGRTSPQEEYYGGSGLWGPIMGAPFDETVAQWSKGEYNNPSNTEDDLNIISTRNGFTYRTDAVGNTIGTATPLTVSSTGVITVVNGIIEKNTDLDFFSFTTSGGTVTINANPAPRHGDLDIKISLYNSAGTVIGTADGSALAATLSAGLSAGTYYISIDGVGSGDPKTTGYSDYASLGTYSISGSIPNTTVTLRTPENPTGTVSGLNYSYYEGNWSALPTFSSLTPVKTGVSSTYSLASRNRDDQFAYQFTGYINVPTDGVYNFYTTSDDGSKLYIGTTQVVNNDGLHGATEASGSIGLKAGRHAITVAFFEQGGDQVLEVRYDGPGVTKQLVPASVLSRTNTITSGIATFYQHCNYDVSGYGIGLGVGTYTLAQLNAAGIADNDISSIKVTSGYEVLVYADDNLAGTTKTYSADVACLVSDNLNDVVSSVVIRAVTTTNTPPTVSITGPANNAAFTAPATVNITANASDANGTVTKVDFYNGSTLLFSDNTAPYSYSWTGVGAGAYNLTAKATDNAGAVTTSSAVSIVVNTVVTNNPPTVSLTGPATTTYTAPATISITANAADSDGSVTKVDFYNGSALLFSDNTAPYSYSWPNVAAGTYTLSAKATDNSGAVTTSSTITVTVTNPTTNSCSGLASYIEGNNYQPGSKVQSGGKIYECKPWPYSGWCNGAAWAYGPGTGTAWTDAWTLVGNCTARIAADQSTGAVSPNPTSGLVTIRVENASTVVVVNSYGEVMIPATQVAAEGTLDLSALPTGIYMLKIDNGTEVITEKIVKN